MSDPQRPSEAGRASEGYAAAQASGSGLGPSTPPWHGPPPECRGGCRCARGPEGSPLCGWLRSRERCHEPRSPRGGGRSGPELTGRCARASAGRIRALPCGEWHDPTGSRTVSPGSKDTVEFKDPTGSRTVSPGAKDTAEFKTTGNSGLDGSRLGMNLGHCLKEKFAQKAHAVQTQGVGARASHSPQKCRAPGRRAGASRIPFQLSGHLRPPGTGPGSRSIPGTDPPMLGPPGAAFRRLW